MDVYVSLKGQIEIPEALRLKLGIRAGDRLEISEENGCLVLRPAPGARIENSSEGLRLAMPSWFLENNLQR